MIAAILSLIGSVLALAIILVPKIWKSPQDEDASRKEKAKEEWDANYKKTDL